MINIIVAMDKNGLIGDGNKLPWYLPEDLKYFKKVTSGKVIVMGSKTFESIGKPLPNRTNVVMSRDTNKYWQNTKILSQQTVKSIVEWSNEGQEIFIIGGAEIYKEFYPYCEKLYITYVNDIYKGNIYFPINTPQINLDFELESRSFSKDKKCEFIIMRRKK